MMIDPGSAKEQSTTIRFTLPVWELFARIAGWGLDNRLMQTRAMSRWGQEKVLELLWPGFGRLPEAITLCTVGDGCSRITSQMAVELLEEWDYPVR